MYKAIFILSLVVVLSCSCKKSCITCLNQGGQTYPRFDSSNIVSYDNVLHRYDTLLVKVDTIYRFDSIYILHYCPGSQQYNVIISSESLNYGSYACSYDQE